MGFLPSPNISDSLQGTPQPVDQPKLPEGLAERVFQRGGRVLGSFFLGISVFPGGWGGFHLAKGNLGRSFLFGISVFRGGGGGGGGGFFNQVTRKPKREDRAAKMGGAPRKLRSHTLRTRDERVENGLLNGGIPRARVTPFAIKKGDVFFFRD